MKSAICKKFLDMNGQEQTLAEERLRYFWSKFVFERTLNQDPRSKRISTLGSIESAPAIIEIEKLGLNEDDIERILSHHGGARISSLAVNHYNDKWTSMLCSFVNANNGFDFKVDITYPASQIDIDKGSPQEVHFIKETPAVYEKYVKDYIHGHPVDRSHWIRNILNGTHEQDSVLYRRNDPKYGICILPDSKWDRLNIMAIYLLCIFDDESLLSVRDLHTKDHLTLLRRTRNTISQVLHEKYSIPITKVRTFFHYQPTFYKLHIHICHVSLDAPGMLVGRAHLLDDVIDNMENISLNYYQIRTLNYTLPESHELFRTLNPSISSNDAGM